MGVRQQRAYIGVQGRSDAGNAVYAPNDHLVDHTRQIGLDLIQRAAQRVDNALSVDSRWFYYYKRRESGRLCSCVSGEQVSPSSTCLICYGTRIVGGYDKYGTWSETLDTTCPQMDTVNVTVRPEPRPSAFILEPDATYGVIRTVFDVRNNAGYVDGINVAAKGRVTVNMRAVGDTIWQSASSAVLLTLLSAPQIEIEVVLQRSSVSAESPVFLKLWFRYGLLPKSEIQIAGDIPPNTEAISLQEYGFDEQFGSIQVIVGSAGHKKQNRVTTYTVDDFLYYIERSRHWKITEVKPNYALGVYTSHELTCRWVQSYEVYKKFPI